MQQARGEVLVKKYSNRRLYDTAASKYVTLDELAETIRKGHDVRVVDAKSQEDLTQQTLTQMILDSGRANRLLPIGLLHQLIRMTDDNLAEFLGRYVSWALEMYMAAKSGAQAIAPFNPLATLPFQATNAVARFFNTGPGWQPPAAPEVTPDPPAPPPSPAAPTSDREAIEDLRKELADLKAALMNK